MRPKPIRSEYRAFADALAAGKPTYNFFHEMITWPLFPYRLLKLRKTIAIFIAEQINRKSWLGREWPLLKSAEMYLKALRAMRARFCVRLLASSSSLDKMYSLYLTTLGEISMSHIRPSLPSHILANSINLFRIFQDLHIEIHNCHSLGVSQRRRN
jgi:hypothetical protein